MNQFIWSVPWTTPPSPTVKITCINLFLENKMKLVPQSVRQVFQFSKNYLCRRRWSWNIQISSVNFFVHLSPNWGGGIMVKFDFEVFTKNPWVWDKHKIIKPMRVKKWWPIKSLVKAILLIPALDIVQRPDPLKLSFK